MSKDTDNLKLVEVKNKCKEIIEKEAKQYGIKLDIEPITVVEFYNSEFFLKNAPTKLEQMQIKFDLRKSGGFFYPPTEKIMIFIDRIGKGEMVDSVNKFSAILFSMFHEFKHQLQKLNKDTTETTEFIINIERLMRSLNPKDYSDNHDRYYLELEAYYYAYFKTLKYLEENCKKEYISAKSYLEAKWISQCNYNQINYNFGQVFDKFYNLCQLKKYDMNSFHIPYLNLFINKKNQFQSLEYIINNLQTTKLDLNIIYDILCSESFLKQIDVTKLNNYEKYYLLNIIVYELKHEQQRAFESKRCYKERKIQSQEYLKSLNTTIDKIKYLKLEIKRFQRTIIIKSKNISKESKHKKLQKNIIKQLKS